MSQTHSDLHNSPRIQYKEEFYFKGCLIKVLLCHNLGDRKSIQDHGRLWHCEVLTPRNETKYYRFSEDYLYSIKNQPKQVTDHTWANTHSVKFY